MTEPAGTGSPSAPRRPLGSPSFGDLLAGLSVALVAIPQALAYAELAGMPIVAGLYALALPAIAAAFLVSSPYLQTGPVALTALLVFGTLSPLAEPESAAYVGLAALLALVVGGVRILVGLLRFGALAYLLSQPVLMGFTTAAAILILSSQLPTALAVAPPVDGVLQRAFWALVHPGSWHVEAVLLSAITVAVVLLGRRLHPLFPGVLAAVGLAIGYSVLFGFDGPVVGEVPAGLPRPSLDLPWAALPRLLVGGVVIALVGFAEAASISRTYATQDRSPWDANREFLSQGAANLAAGVVGGFPVGGSFSRSSVNRLAGARSRWSGAVTGLVVLAFLPFTGVLADLPKAVLGAIVIAAVLNLIRLRQLLQLFRFARTQAAIAWITFGLTLGLSPRIDLAVIVGIGLAIGQHLRREQALVLEHSVDGDTLHFRPLGVLWFGSAPQLEERLAALLAASPDTARLELHLGGLGRIDVSAALMLDRLIRDAGDAGLEVVLQDVPPMGRRWVERLWRPTLEAMAASQEASRRP